MGDDEATGALARYTAAIVGGVPLLGPLLQEAGKDAIQAVVDEQERLHSTALRAAEVASGLSREEMAERLRDHPETIPIASRVLFQAGMTNQDEVLEALGAILGSILLNPEGADEVELVLIGIGDLRRIHLQVLRAMTLQPQVRVLVQESYDLTEHFDHVVRNEPLAERAPDEDGYVTQAAETWNDMALAAETGISLTQTQLALAGLMKAGFIVSPTVLNGPGYLIAPAGELVLEVLQRYQAHARGGGAKL